MIDILDTNIDITNYTSEQINTEVSKSTNVINQLYNQIGRIENGAFVPGEFAEEIQDIIDAFNNDDPRRFSVTQPTPNQKYTYWTWFHIKN